MMYAVTVVACTYMISTTLAFFPSRLTDLDLGQGTLTHQDITELGVLQAVALFFEDNPKPGTSLEPGQLSEMKDITAQKLFQAYYGDEASGLQLQTTIDDIVAGNNIIYKDFFHRAASHHNGETIREANEEMIEIREDIISALNSSTANFDLASELIGHYLHMLQMFYSNTNWVELFGSEVYHSLGIRGKPILPQAPSIMSTCVNCRIVISWSFSENCRNNLIGDDGILTSGYRSGQTPEKPYRDPLEFESGKCSHGGVFDTSGESSAALGGINKDSFLPSLSPHYHLHFKAAQAAIKHTTEFFNNKDYGLRYMIGEEQYQQYLQLKSGTSLVFTIDYSGSMSDDIVAVKEQVSAILLETLDTVYQPANFIVVLFNDPLTLTEVFISEDGNAALEFVGSIRVTGGGDCPEYAMDGIEKALAVCHPYSKMFVFTDADAKDEDRADFVQSLAERKNVELHFFLTGSCGSSGRKRRDTQSINENRHGPNHTRQKRSTTSVAIYDVLAAATGGTVYVTDKAGIAKATNVIKETLSTTATILKKKITSSEATNFNLSITIDNTTRQVLIQLTASPALLTELFDPSGYSADVNITDIGVGKIIKLSNPTPGIWTLNVNDTEDVTVEVSAQSALDVTSTFVQSDPRTGFQYEIIGRPVSGDSATVVVYVPSKELITSVDTIQLVDTDGSEITSHTNFQDIASRTDTGLYKVIFPLPAQIFQVSVSGADKDGNRFTRLQGNRIVPVAIELSVVPINETLYVNEMVTVNFEVINKGGNSTIIIVNILDDKGFAQSPKELTFTLDPSGNETGSFLLKSGPTPDITTVTISAKADSSVDDSSQFVIIRVVAKERIIRPEDNINPRCNVTSITGSCDGKKVDPCSCSKHIWTGSAEILDDGFGLFRISSSLRVGSFHHDNFTYGYNGTVVAHFESDCCNPRVYITAADLASNTGVCVIDMAPGVSLPLPVCPTPTPSPPSSTIQPVTPPKSVLLIIGVSAATCGVIVVLTVIAILCVVVRGKRPKTVEQDTGIIRGTKPKPVEQDTNYMYDQPEIRSGSKNSRHYNYF